MANDFMTRQWFHDAIASKTSDDNGDVIITFRQSNNRSITLTASAVIDMFDARIEECLGIYAHIMFLKKRRILTAYDRGLLAYLWQQSMESPISSPLENLLISIHSTKATNLYKIISLIKNMTPRRVKKLRHSLHADKNKLIAELLKREAYMGKSFCYAITDDIA